MGHSLTNIAEWANVDRATFRSEIVARARPAVLKGAVRHWPVVSEGLKSPGALCDYLKPFDIGRPVSTFEGAPGINGRFFYRPDMQGFNFERRDGSISGAMDRMLAQGESPQAIYVQSTPIPEYMPALAQHLPFDLVHPSVPGRIWIGNAVVVTTHYDLSENLACVVAGRRRFTLFPPEQLPNLYVGPLEFTPGGAPVSMVDLDSPDLARYPRFADALAAAETADLEPGDVLYIPYMWWHHVRSLDRLNVLVNYWWNDARTPLASPYDCLLHALLALREMPPDQRTAWRALFDYHVFKVHGEPLEHLAPQHRGGLGPMTPERAQHLKMTLLRALTRTIAGQ
jgi:hypothetical protein